MGIDKNYGDAYSLGLVMDKLAQLSERPAMQCGSLTLPSRYPSADMFEVFKCYSASSALSVFHNALADRVVYIIGKTRFFLGTFLEKSFGRLSAFLLELLAKPTSAMSNIIHLAGRIHMAARVYRYVCHSKVNANHVSNVNGFWFRNFTCSKQVELVINQGEISLTMPELQKFVLSSPTNKPDFLSATQTPNRDFLFSYTPVQYPVIVSNSPILAKCAECLGIKFVSISYFADAAHHYLSRKWKGLSNLGVGQLLNLKLTECAYIPSYLADCVTSIVRCFQRSFQEYRLLIGGQELNFGCKFHVIIVSQNVNRLKGGWCVSSAA
jgi:hypothetical protein